LVLPLVYNELGKYEEAEPLYQKTWQIRSWLSDLTTLSDPFFNSLAVLLRAPPPPPPRLAKYTEAELSYSGHAQ